MAYRTDGSSHRTGVKSEIELMRLMQESHEMASEICGTKLEEGGYEVVPKGGTQFKEDLTVQTQGRSINISHKKKKKLSTGSFDWLNTTKNVPQAEKLKSLGRKLRDSNCSVSAARSAFYDACNQTLNNLSSDDIKKIIHDNVISKYDGIDRITIKVEDKKIIYSFPPNAIPFFEAVRNPDVSIKTVGTGKTSRRLQFINRDDQVLPDYGLRIRLTTNNGITAMLGKSKKNKYSSPVIKLQQDKVHKLVESMAAAGKLTELKES